ncbi:MAG: hypothetical protein E3J81_02220 [Dehalococcoidia bacterium]|nr:MAG: hypothetical protein E3J81_02220 [Dehalococcoidia bacterium]
MWVEVAEKEIVLNTREVCAGLIVAGMAANAVFGSPRMGAIFGGMVLSGKRAAELTLDFLSAREVCQEVAEYASQHEYRKSGDPPFD